MRHRWWWRFAKLLILPWYFSSQYGPLMLQRLRGKKRHSMSVHKQICMSIKYVMFKIWLMKWKCDLETVANCNLFLILFGNINHVLSNPCHSHLSLKRLYKKHPTWCQSKHWQGLSSRSDSSGQRSPMVEILRKDGHRGEEGQTVTHACTVE